MPVSSSYFSGSTVRLAKRLIGAFLIHNSPGGKTIGRIVETEAYLFKGDPACHAHRGQTKRNSVMFGPPGRAYVYLIYGMYYCVNVVSNRLGVGEAVLIRALEPLAGLELMAKRRNTEQVKNLCNGPGKLAQAMGIDKALNGACLLGSPLKLKPENDLISKYPLTAPKQIVCTTRIGISAGSDLPLRFYLKGSKFVSKPIR